MITEKIPFEMIKMNLESLGYYCEFDASHHTLFVKSSEHKHTIDITVNRNSQYYIVDSDNNSIYRVGYTKHKNLDRIITKVKIKMMEK